MESNSSAEKQSVYSTAPADRAMPVTERLGIYIFIYIIINEAKFFFADLEIVGK